MPSEHYQYETNVMDPDYFLSRTCGHKQLNIAILIVDISRLRDRLLIEFSGETLIF